MTQRAPTPWLVSLPAGDTTHVTRSSFAAACRGHEKIGEVLGYFVYEASWQAKNEGLDVQSEDCTFITIHREAKHMLTRMKVCQKSLIAYIKQLSEWGFITADGYRHTYQVHFQAINAAIQHPPEAIKRKPRGQHAPKPDVKVQSSEKLSQLQSSLVKLQSRLVKIQTETVKIQTRIVNLQTRIVKIQSSESCESASEQGVMGDMEAPRIYKNNKRSNKKKDSFVVSASAEHNRDTSLSLSSSFEEKNDQVGNMASQAGIGQEEKQNHQVDEMLLEEKQEGIQNGNAPTEAFQRTEVPEERPVSALPRGQACEADGLGTSTSIEQDTIPEYTAQENNPATSKTKKKKNSQTRTPIKECSPEIQSRRRAWQEHFNQRRGGERLPLTTDRMNESNGIASLVATYTDAEITALDQQLYTQDKYWSDPERRHDLSGFIVWKKSVTTKTVLKERGKWPGQEQLEEKREMPTFTPEGYDAADEFGAYWGINELRTVSHAAL